MRRLYLARGAGGARGNRYSRQVEADHGGFGLETGRREQSGIRQPRRVVREDQDARGLAEAVFQPIPQAYQGEWRRFPARPWLLSPRRQNRRFPRHSRFPPDGRAPDRRRAAAAQAPARPRPKPRRRRPWGRRSCAQKRVTRSAFNVLILKGIFPNAWIASTCSRPPAAWTISATSAMGCIAPVSLLASMIDTSAGGPPASASRRRSETHQAGTRHADRADRLGRKPPAREHRGVLDGRNHQPLDRQSGRPPQPWRQRQGVGLGSPRGEDDVPGQRADGAGDRRPGILDQPAGLAALIMDRGGIAGQIPCRGHRLPRLWTKRGGRIPVEIDAVGHGPS